MIFDPSKAGQQVISSELPAHAALDATIYHTVFRAPQACKVQSVKVVPDAAVTGLDSPYYADLNLFKIDADGTPLVQLAAIAYKLGTDEVALVTHAFTIAAAPVSLAVGQLLAIQRNLSGIGGIATPRYQVLTTVSP
jgi:hypothetical protein